MSMDWKVVPIDRWPGEQTRERKSHPFRTTDARGWSRSGVNWSGTVELLERELKMLDAEDVLLQMAVDRSQIRQDGWIYANARPEHPGVILTFESKHGPLSYPCDTFDDWQANIRAIALALEALRKVDRYGVTKTGEQYRGFAQLPPAGGSTSTLTAEAAARVILDASGWGVDSHGDPDDVPGDVEAILSSDDEFRAFYRDATKRTHPDAGGSVRDFQLVQEAKRVLEAHHGGRA